MGNLLYHRPSDRITAGSWSLSTGTARTGYGLTNLDDGDPSTPLWLSGTSMRIVRDFGSATQVDHIYIFAHNFVQSANLRLQMHTANSWGAPDLDLPITIPTAYADGYAYHLHVDVAAAVTAAASRTKRYLSIVNSSANAVTCAIGEVWMVGSGRTLTRNVRWGFAQPRQRLTSAAGSKRGVSTVYDYGTIERRLEASFPMVSADFDDLRALEADARGASLSFPIVLAPTGAIARQAEPMLVRLAESVTPAPFDHLRLLEARLVFSELGQGEILGA